MILVLALVIGVLVSKNAGEDKEIGKGNSSISTDKDKSDKEIIPATIQIKAASRMKTD